MNCSVQPDYHNHFEDEMADGVVYQKMYLTLFNAVTTAIHALSQQKSDQAREILIVAQQRTEEIFLSVGEA